MGPRSIIGIELRDKGDGLAPTGVATPAAFLNEIALSSLDAIATAPPSSRFDNNNNNHNNHNNNNNNDKYIPRVKAPPVLWRWAAIRSIKGPITI